MDSKFFPGDNIDFVDHPKFKGVKIAALITRKDTGAVSVCRLDIAPNTEIPIHTHDPQIDSIFVVEGEGEGYMNGVWSRISAGDYIFVPALIEHGIRNTGTKILKLFVHHSPPFI